MINRVVLVGRLTRDPELKAAGSSQVCSFTLAVQNPFAKAGEQKTADFIPCVVWNKPAEILSKYTRKGSLIGVEGKIITRNYEKDGKRVYVVEVLCDSIQLLESKGASQSRQVTGDEYSQNEPTVNEYENQSHGIDINDDDLPF